METRNKLHGWQDFMELGVASWLVASPFILGFFSNVSASLSCMFIGCLVITLSIIGMALETPWEEWTTICLAVALMATPWVFGFTEVGIAVLNVFISGGLLIVFSTLAIKHEYHELHQKQAVKIKN